MSNKCVLRVAVLGALLSLPAGTAWAAGPWFVSSVGNDSTQSRRQESASFCTSRRVRLCRRIVTNEVALTGAAAWHYSGSYGSPASGTPFTPYVATVAAPNAASTFGAGLDSSVTMDCHL